MNDDIAGEVHRKFYGKSDKINAHENQNPELQVGYSAGMGSLGFDARKVIEEELSLSHEVGDDFCVGMMECVRGSGRNVVRWRRLAARSGKGDD